MIISLLYLLLAFIPVLIYITIIWSTTPWRSINLKTAFGYLTIGILNMVLLYIFLILFPKWQYPVQTLNINNTILVMAFIQTAMVEELFKFLAFRIGEKLRIDSKSDSVIGTMFYCGISALGFSFVENVQYAIFYGGHILLARSLTTMMIHLLCGLIMGYWIAASRIPSKLENRSLIEVIFIKNPRFKKVSYYIIGIICAIILHGLFDFNIMSRGHIEVKYIIILGGIVSAYLAAKDLNERG